MFLPKQKIWDAGDESYVDGPDLIPGTKTFAGYCSPQSISKSKNKIGINRTNTTTSSENDALYLDENGQFRARRPLRPTGNQFAGFKRGCMVTSKLWLTTYPFMERLNNNNLLGETVLFHVHSSAPAIEEPPEAPPAISWISSWLPRIGLDLPEISSPWRKPITNLQIAPAAPSHHDIDDADQQRPQYVVNQGPILRANIDVLYLDKSFWRQYFDRCTRGPDIFVPGVYPKDLAQVQRVAVDIAVLRNRDEFAAVARALRRHLPNLRSFQAVVTKIIPRFVAEPEEQIALLEDGLPNVYVSLEEKVRLGVHESVDHVPSQGIVSANLSRLNVLGSGSLIQTRYMLLAYFDGAAQGLRGESPDVDLPVTQDAGESSLPALNLKRREIKSPVSPATKARRKNNSQSPTTYRHRRGSSTQSRPRSSNSTPSTARSPNLPFRKDLDRRHETPSPKSPKDNKTKKIFKKIDTTTPRQNTDTKSNSASIKREPPSSSSNLKKLPVKASPLLPDTAAPPSFPSPRQTPAQLAATRRAQEPSKQAFRTDHPATYLRIPTSGQGALCAWRAIQASWTAAVPRLARITRLPEATLRGVVTVETLEEERVRDGRDPDGDLQRAGVVMGDERNFTVDYAARVFRRVVWRRTGLPMDLGCLGPLQREAFGGGSEDLFYLVLGGPSSSSGEEGGRGGDEQALLAPAVGRVWIWNNNEPGVGHYEGIRDAA